MKPSTTFTEWSHPPPPLLNFLSRVGEKASTVNGSANAVELPEVTDFTLAPKRWTQDDIDAEEMYTGVGIL